MEWLTLLPPAVAIFVAVWKKDVIIALLSALLTAELLHSHFNIGLGFLALFDRIVSVFSSASNTRVLVFSLLIGALLALMRKSGGVSAFVQWVSKKAWPEVSGGCPRFRPCSAF